MDKSISHVLQRQYGGQASAEIVIAWLNHTQNRHANTRVVKLIDLLRELARFEGALVFISVTSLDGDLARELEPRAPQPARRLAAVEALSQGGIPTGVLVAPVIPGLTDHEMPAILSAAAKAGALVAGYVPLRLPYGVASLFEEWLTLHRPLRKDKILSHIRSIRGGKLNDPNFGTRMQGSGPYAEQIADLFEVSCRKAGLNSARPKLSVAAFHRPGPAQLPLF